MDGKRVILLVDAGNTRIKFGWLDRSDMRREPAALALAHAELDRLRAWLEQLPAPAAGARGVNVAGAAMAARIDSIVESHSGHRVQWSCSTARAADIVNLYDEPA